MAHWWMWHLAAVFAGLALVSVAMFAVVANDVIRAWRMRAARDRISDLIWLALFAMLPLLGLTATGAFASFAMSRPD